MSHFCHQISFTSAAWTRVLQSSHDRFEAIRAPLESLGGKISSAFFAVDSYDVLVLTEFPDRVSASDIDIALFAAGDIASIHTTHLLGASQVLEAARKSASPSAYRPTPHVRALAASAT